MFRYLFLMIDISSHCQKSIRKIGAARHVKKICDETHIFSQRIERKLQSCDETQVCLEIGVLREFRRNGEEFLRSKKGESPERRQRVLGEWQELSTTNGK